MGNSVNQEKLISLNFILIEAFKWVVDVLVKVMLGRSFQLPEGVSGWRKEKNSSNSEAQIRCRNSWESDRQDSRLGLEDREQRAEPESPKHPLLWPRA